jgi:hypothetical protein
MRRHPAGGTVHRLAAAGLSSLLAASVPQAGLAQDARIDTVIITVGDPFPAEQAQSFLPRAMNALHLETKPRVIRRELLLREGDFHDSTLAAESVRILRAMQIFKEVEIDSVRLDDGRLALRVVTRDAWTTSPAIGLGVGAGGTVTYKLGLSELNLLGTGTLAYASYRKDVDRRAFEAATKLDNLFGSAINADTYLQALSDGFVIRWDVGDPFRATTDPRAIVFGGEYANQRILQYRATATTLDTTVYDRDAFLGIATAAFGISSRPTELLRLGGYLQVRQERFVPRVRDSSIVVGDSVSAALGVAMTWQRSRYLTLRRFNGLGSEDIDAGLYVSGGIVVAAEPLGYERTGFGPDITVRGTLPFTGGFATLHAEGHGIFDGNGLDSGAVEVRLTGGYKLAERHATVIHVQAGAMEGQTPGAEYDLGFNVPPRSWAPHAFVGNRTVWGALEHKWYVVDALFGLFGAAIAGFVDYGGAWFKGEDARFGGNVGIGLRMGSALGAVARTGRIDLGWRFGGGVTGDAGPVLSIGMGWVFGGGRDPTCEPAVYHVRYRCRPRES